MNIRLSALNDKLAAARREVAWPLELVGLSLQPCPGRGSHRSPAGGSTIRYVDADCGEVI